MLISISPGIQAQEVYSLQRCRELALQNNRQLKVSRMAADVAENTHKAAKTKYLPRVDALAGYQHFSREISLLNDKQKQALGNLGTNTVGQLGGQIGQNLSSLVQQGLISPQAAQQLGQVLGSITTPLTQAGNNIGQVSTMPSAQTQRTSTAVASSSISPSIWAGPSRLQTTWQPSVSRLARTTSVSNGS